MRLKIDWISCLLTATAAGLCMTMAWTMLRASEHVHDAAGWVEHTRHVQSELANLHASLYRTQGLARAYALTHDPAARQETRQAMPLLPAGLAAVQRLTIDNPVQQQRLAAMNLMLDAYTAELQEMLRVLDAGGAAAARQRLAMGAPWRTEDALRNGITAALAHESDLLAARVEMQAVERDGLRQLIFGALAGTFALMLGAILILRLDRRRIAAAEARLAAQNAVLEQRVEERTRTLQHALARIELIFDAMSDGVNSLDRDFRYTYVSRRAGELLQRDPASMLGRCIWDLYPDLLHGEVHRLFDAALQSGQPQEGERLLENYNNVWYAFHIAPAPEGITVFFHDVTRRHMQEQRLREYSARMEQLSRRLIAVGEEQRRILARELHDEIGQGLTAIKFNFSALQAKGPATAARPAADGLELTDRIIAQVRDRMLELRPALLDDLGLTAAVDEYSLRQAARTGMRIDFAPALLLPRLPEEIETTAFRVVQEAIHNALRHAACHRIEVNLEAEDGSLLIEVRDDGKGLAATSPQDPARIGIAGMRERVALLGGRFSIDSPPGGGTVLRAALPLQHPVETA